MKTITFGNGYLASLGNIAAYGVTVELAIAQLNITLGVTYA